MLKHLTEDQFEQLKQHLIVPNAVSDILRHDLDIEPDMQYGLHMALSEIDPDSALLAIALCACDIAEKNIMRAPIAGILQQEAHNIIEEYGPTWLRYYKNSPMSPEVFEGILETVSEDLESLADLMETLCADLDETHSATALLANLLSIQARAHMEIADYILAEMAFEKASGDSSDSGENATVPTQDLIDLDAHTGNNIVLFPGTVRH